MWSENLAYLGDATPEGVVREALREFVGDGDGGDQEVLERYNATIVAEALKELLKSQPSPDERFMWGDAVDDPANLALLRLGYAKGLATVEVNPECRRGYHGNCSEWARIVTTGESVPCQCACHSE